MFRQLLDENYSCTVQRHTEYFSPQQVQSVAKDALLRQLLSHHESSCDIASVAWCTAVWMTRTLELFGVCASRTLPMHLMFEYSFALRVT